MVQQICLWYFWNRLDPLTVLQNACTVLRVIVLCIVQAFLLDPADFVYFANVNTLYR